LFSFLLGLLGSMSVRAMAKVSARLAKEERAHMKEERKAVDVGKEFPPWAPIDYDFQTEEFFRSVRHLPNECLNPKLDLTLDHVTEADIAEVFGGKGVKPFKATNVMLHPATKSALLSLCWKIYGTAILANNEFMAWIVKGFVVKQKGDVKINWAVAAASTAIEKKRRDAVERVRVAGSMVNSQDLTECLGSELDLGTRSHGDVSSRGVRRMSDLKPSPFSVSLVNQCPFKLAQAELQRVHTAADLSAEIFRISNGRTSELKEEKKAIELRLVGLRFNLEDRLRAVKEDGLESNNAAKHVEDLRRILQGVSSEVSIRIVSVDYFESCFPMNQCFCFSEYKH
jgi:hypothetical protein